LDELRGSKEEVEESLRVAGEEMEAARSELQEARTQLKAAAAAEWKLQELEAAVEQLQQVRGPRSKGVRGVWCMVYGLQSEQCSACWQCSLSQLSRMGL
jgi:chromosome segregation ATPase